MKFDLLIDAGVIIAETPIWDNRIQKLYWTDLFSGDVHQYDPAYKTENVWKTGKPIGAAIPCDVPSKLLCALEGGLFLLDLTSGGLSFVANPEQRPDFKYNDTRIGPGGRIFTSSVSRHFGTDRFTPDMRGAFYMVNTDGTSIKLAEDIEQYNGITWNKECTKMYVVDTGNQQLLVFPYNMETGASAASEIGIDLVDIGMPDGLSIDADDNLYICHWSGKISVWDQKLTLKKIINFPVNYVCCCGFGGKKMKDFYVATSRYNYTNKDLEQNPGAGGIFHAKSPIAGRFDYFFSPG